MRVCKVRYQILLYMLVVAEQWMIGNFRPALAVALGRMGQVILTLVFVARRLAFVLFLWFQESHFTLPTR